MANKFCTNCGSLIEDREARFCQICGADLSAQVVEESTDSVSFPEDPQMMPCPCA